ncbi:MAG: GNAT family N-acetyltransferase [Candidatus Kryptoniota bacterium]
MADLKIEKAGAAAYAKFLSVNPPGNPYSLLPLLEAYRDTFSCEFELVFITRNETAIASCALFAGEKFSQRIVRLMPIRPYDGVNFRKLGESNNQKQEYEKLLALQALEDYLEKNFSFHQMIFPPGFLDVRSFQYSGATVIPQYTYIVDMDNFSENNYTKSLKEVLRAAEHSCLAFGTCSVEELTKLQQLSYERHGRKAPVSAEGLSRLLEKLNSAGLIEINCVKNKDGEILAGLAQLKMDNASYFYVSGTNADAGKGASHLLYHEILKAEKKSGKSFVDFCGANTPTINLFKSAFQPRLQIYFKIWRANRVFTRLASLVKKM